MTTDRLGTHADEYLAQPSGGRTLLQAILSALPPMLIVFFAVGAALTLTERLSMTKLAVLVGGFMAALLAIRLQLLQAMLLVGFTVALTYSRNYYLVSRTGESQGLYWIPADVTLMALAGLWLLEAVRRRLWTTLGVGRIWFAIVPLLLVALLSATTAPRPDWVLYDSARILRGFAILLLLSLIMNRRTWWILLVGLGTAMVGQSMYGAMQVALRRSSFVLEGESVARAAGTMMHPNLLAGFLLLTVPTFLAIGFGGPRTWWRWLALGAGVVGIGGLVVTMSRLPNAVMIGQIGLIAIGLILMRRTPVQRWIGFGAIGILAGAIALTPFSDKIYRRIVGNWGSSVEFRSKVNAFAYERFEKNPVTGIGLNHFTDHMLDFNPIYRKLYKLNVEDAKKINVRYMLAVHNAYLLPLAELGAPGLLAWLYLLGSILGVGVLAIFRCRGVVQVACLGMTVGLIGLYIQGFSEYAMHIEQVFYPLLIVGALLHFAPRLESRPNSSSTSLAAQKATS